MTNFSILQDDVFEVIAPSPNSYLFNLYEVIAPSLNPYLLNYTFIQT